MRAVRFAALILLAVLMVACYTLVPTRGMAPPVGTNVAFDVTDVGRVALGGSMGPEIAQIEGRLLDTDTAGYVVAVSNVRLLRGGVQAWSGERVRIHPDHVRSAYERRFSRGRSIAMGVAIVGGVVAFVGGRSLLGIGENDDEPPPDTIITRIGRPR